MSSTTKNPEGRPTGFRWKPPQTLADKYYTRREAMVALGVCESTLSKILRANLLESIKYETHTLILKKSVQFYVSSRTGDGLPPPEIKKAKGRGPRA